MRVTWLTVGSAHRPVRTGLQHLNTSLSEIHIAAIYQIAIHLYMFANLYICLKVGGYIFRSTVTARHWVPIENMAHDDLLKY